MKMKWSVGKGILLDVVQIKTDDSEIRSTIFAKRN